MTRERERERERYKSSIFTTRTANKKSICAYTYIHTWIHIKQTKVHIKENTKKMASKKKRIHQRHQKIYPYSRLIYPLNQITVSMRGKRLDQTWASYFYLWSVSCTMLYLESDFIKFLLVIICPLGINIKIIIKPMHLCELRYSVSNISLP